MVPNPYPKNVCYDQNDPIAIVTQLKKGTCK